MTARNRSTLQALFQTGDTPQGQDYADMIDSALNLTDSSAQTMTSKLTVGGGVETTNVTAQRVFGSAATFTGTVSANVLNASDEMRTSGLVIRQATSASSAWFNGPVKFESAVGVGTAAPTEGIAIFTSGETNLRLHMNTTAAVSGPASARGYFFAMVNGTKRRIPFF